ncbi:MAG: LptF/LptG family permease [Hydrogenophilus sp.]|nr:LptF/LptG family permease [Hydrogenophilus sp.]
MLFDRSILAEFARNALFFMLALVAILAAVLWVRLLGRTAEGELPADLLLAYFPWAVVDQLPLAVVLSGFAAALLTFQRSIRDAEWVVWRSLGVSRRRFLWPMGVAGVVGGAVLVGMTGWVSPYAEHQKAALRAKAKTRDEAQQVAPGVFRVARDGSRVLFVGGEREKGMGPFFWREVRRGKEIIAVAEGARVETQSEGRWVVLSGGARYQEGDAPRAWGITAFAEMRIWLAPATPTPEGVRLRSVPLPALWLSAMTGNRAAAGEVVGRLGLPIAWGILLMLALPLAEFEPRAARGASLALALVLFLLYVNGLSLVQSEVGRGRVGFATGLLLPHLVAGGAGILLAIWRIRRTL